MDSLNQILRAKNSLTMDVHQWSRWNYAPGSFRDRIIAVEHHASARGDWEIREAIITEPAYVGVPVEDYHLSLVVGASTERPSEADYSAGKVLRPSIPGYFAFGDDSSIRNLVGFGPLHTITIYLPKKKLHERLRSLSGHQTHSLEVLLSRSWRDPLTEATMKNLMSSCRMGESQIVLDELVDTVSRRLLVLSKHPTSRLIGDGQKMPEAIKRVIDYVSADPGLDHSRETLASIAGVEPHHFNRLFRQSTGETPMAFVRGKRLELAREMLMSAPTEVSIEQIAKNCGFTHSSHLSRHFRERYGVTPAVLRSAT